MQKPKSVGALYCFLPVITENTLQSSRSASSCRCLGSCEEGAHLLGTAHPSAVQHRAICVGSPRTFQDRNHVQKC